MWVLCNVVGVGAGVDAQNADDVVDVADPSARSMPRAACCTLHAACCMLQVASCILPLLLRAAPAHKTLTSISLMVLYADIKCMTVVTLKITLAL